MSDKPVGLAAHGQPMPQTIQEWKYLGDMYEAALLLEKVRNSALRSELHNTRVKLDRANEKLVAYRKELDNNE